MNGVRRADFVCHTSNSGVVDIRYTAFNGQPSDTVFQTDGGWCFHRGATLHLGDMNADGRADLVCHTKTNGIVDVRYTDGNGRVSSSIWQSDSGWCYHKGAVFSIADVDGTGAAEAVCTTARTRSIRISWARDGRPSLRDEMAWDDPIGVAMWTP